jgi:hypothetical protein
MTDTWETIKSFDEEVSAQAFAGHLRAEDVPAEVVVQSDLPGLIVGVDVLVPTDFADRARIVLNSLQPTDAELVFAATGELGTGDDDESQ